MKMRNHWMLAVGGGGCTVLLLVALVFLLRAAAAFRAQGEAIDRQYQRLAELNARNPFPSLENVEQMRENLSGFKEHVGVLEKLLGRDPFPPDAIEAAEFSARAQGVIERFRKRVEEAGIVLPETLEVGFAQYASGGAVPDQVHVPRLSRQLYSVERVAETLVDSGVTSIDALKREAFEAPVVATPVPRRRSRRKVAPVFTPEADLRTVASTVQPDGLYYTERVVATFTTTEDGVWQVLDRLATAPHFMVVAEFSHTTQADVLAYDPPPFDVKGDAAIRDFISSGVLTGDQAIARAERIIAGNEMVRVTLSIDVYNLRQGMEEAAQ